MKLAGFLQKDLLERFENEFSKSVNRKFATSVSSGTAALDVAVRSLGIGPGDEVIIPTFTIISCASAVINVGAKPVLVDCDPITWNMRCEDIANKITPDTKAIMIVHIYGLPVDIDPILDLAKENNLKIIEDAAEMHGQTYKESHAEVLGILVSSVFIRTNILLLRGGMVVTLERNS